MIAHYLTMMVIGLVASIPVGTYVVLPKFIEWIEDDVEHRVLLSFIIPIIFALIASVVGLIYFGVNQYITELLQ